MICRFHMEFPDYFQYFIVSLNCKIIVKSQKIMRNLTKLLSSSFWKLAILASWIFLFQLVINKYAIDTGIFKAKHSDAIVEKIDLKHLEDRLRASGLIDENYHENMTSIDQKIQLVVQKKAHELFEEMKSEGLENELKKFFFKGERKYSIVTSNFRSGSSFVGDFIQSVPGTFYHFEPLLNARVKFNLARYTNRIRRIIKFLKCNLTHLQDYFEHEKKQKYLFKQTRVLEDITDKELLLNYKFIDKVCQIYPFQGMKVMKIELEGFKRIFEKNELNVKVILLVRDPRAVMNSLNTVGWCKEEFGCTDAQNYCDSLVREYYTAKRFIKFYPNYLRIIRYEDFLEDVMTMGRKVMDFYELPFTMKTRSFLLEHTTVDGEMRFFFLTFTVNLYLIYLCTLKINFRLCTPILNLSRLDNPKRSLEIRILLRQCLSHSNKVWRSHATLELCPCRRDSVLFRWRFHHNTANWQRFHIMIDNKAGLFIVENFPRSCLIIIISKREEKEKSISRNKIVVRGSVWRVTRA